jgi:hypothetical protein
MYSISFCSGRGNISQASQSAPTDKLLLDLVHRMETRARRVASRGLDDSSELLPSMAALGCKVVFAEIVQPAGSVIRTDEWGTPVEERPRRGSCAVISNAGFYASGTMLASQSPSIDAEEGPKYDHHPGTYIM